MTNDTTTLNGALQELGETMADNLVTMGVTDAQASDGLTTLANKILDVPQGGTCIQISLTSNKSILSYYDSETATLTATVTENGTPKSGESVQFYKDNVAYGNPVSTDSSGIATISYSSSGSGDVSFTAEVGSLSSETYSIEDCKYAHLPEISYVSEYNSGDHGIDIDNNLSLNLGTNCEISFDAKANNGSSIRARLLLGSKSNQNSNGTYNYTIGAHLETNIITAMYRTTAGATYWGSDVSCTDTYAHYRFVKNGTSLTCYINNNQQGDTQTLSWLDDHTDYLFFWWVYRYGTIYAKNIKVKAL